MSRLSVLVITQKIGQDDDILGFFCGWLNELAKKIDRIYALVLEKRDADLASNIELFSLDKENSSYKLVRFIKFNYLLLKILLNKRIDIIFVHMCPEYVLLVSPYAKIMGVPIVMWYAHGNINIFLRIAHFLVNKVVSSSKDGFRINSRKLTIVGQGIDVKKFKPQDPSPRPKRKEKIVLSVGRVSPIKNYEVLIKAADILVNQNNIRDLKFQIVGGIPLKSQNGYLDSLKAMVRKYNLEDYIQFIGPIPHTQIQNYYKNCDLFLSTSNTGSLDKVVLEAMACEKIVFTSNEAFRNILGKYSKILMFDKKNTFQLVDNIIFTLEMSEESQKKLGQDLRELVVQRHSVDRLAENFSEIFSETLNNIRCSE